MPSPIDISGAVSFMEAQMTDTVTVTRDENRTADDVFDETSGQYVRQVPNTEEIVTDQVCMVLKVGSEESTEHHAGQTVMVGQYTLWTPLDAPDLKKFDVVVVTDSLRNADMIGNEFEISQSWDRTSFPVGKKYRMIKLDRQEFDDGGSDPN